MNEHGDYRTLVNGSQLVALSPCVPPISEVEGMAAKAKRLAGAPSRKTARTWQFAALAAVSVADVAVAVSIMPAGAAFARDRALAALLPPADRILVFSTEISSSDSKAPTLTETTWISAGAGAWRTETRDASGKVVGAKVANGDKALWTEESASALIEETVSSAPESGFPVWLATLRDLIATPDRRVEISRSTVDGVDSWVLKNSRSYDDLVPFEATIAADDYRPKRIAIGGQGEGGNQTATWTITRWTSVPADSLEPDFFSFDQVKRLKPEGTPIRRD